MKNIFKVMGVALLACSMVMVSCKKDDDKDGGSSITEGINVTFDGQNWTAAENDCGYYSGAGAIVLSGAQNEGQYFPSFGEALYATATGSWTESTTDGSFAQDATHVYCEYYEETALTNQAQTVIYGDWWALQATTEITNIDLTALTVSAKANGTMFNAAEAYLDGTGIDGASTANYSATFGNVQMAVANN